MMKMRYTMASGIVAIGLLAGCGAAPINLDPITNNDQRDLNKQEFTEDQYKDWGHADLFTDTIPGMSVEKAYREILASREGTKVIVGVVDSGVDINHEDLKNVIWVNDDEIPDNNIDDDKNGYVDDIHGWNFLGTAVHENLEMTRIVKQGDDGSEMYKAAKAEYDKEFNETEGTLNGYRELMVITELTDSIVREELGKDSYTLEELRSIDAQDEQMMQTKRFLEFYMSQYGSVDEFKTLLEKDMEILNSQYEYHLNTDFDGRSEVGDDPYDINDTDYGNNDVITDLERTRHGTHVAGIIAAQRDNNIGMNGVAANVEIMALRAVPDGDEYDKDIALAIRYAVDNGAKVINGSFGKSFSPNKEWVYDALKYAAEHDVLFVHAAGNDGSFLDEVDNYPNDQEGVGPEFVDNVLTVGALNWDYGEQMVAGFSNYGKSNVDVFAPGTKIYATTPDDTYEYLQGTSMAAPGVAGVAALIRSYFPKLKASQVKAIIMESGLTSDQEVIVAGDPNNKQKFTELSRSGTMVNLYNALIMADKVSRKKIKL